MHPNVSLADPFLHFVAFIIYNTYRSFPPFWLGVDKPAKQPENFDFFKSGWLSGRVFRCESISSTVESVYHTRRFITVMIHISLPRFKYNHYKMVNYFFIFQEGKTVAVYWVQSLAGYRIQLCFIVCCMPVACDDPDDEEGEEGDRDEVLDGEGGPVVDHLLQHLHHPFFNCRGAT